jgi:hypothetical protein
MQGNYLPGERRYMNFIVGLFAVGMACTANYFWGQTGILLLMAFWMGIIQGNIVDIKRK